MVYRLIKDYSREPMYSFRADEAARCAQMYAAEGLRAPAGGARTRLDALLRCIQRLYSRDPHKLRDDYWRACDTNVHSHR